MLPKWPGAEVCYMRAKAMLEHMAVAGHVKRIKTGRRWVCEVSQDMRLIIDAMNAGDEEQLKGLLLERESFAVAEVIHV